MRPTPDGTPVAHKSGDSSAEPELRAYLLADRVAFRHDMGVTLAENPSWSATAWAQLSPPVDALADDRAYRLHRWELPDSQQRFVGSVHDDLVLDERDVLRPASMPVRS
jgi:hypothetical protein